MGVEPGGGVDLSGEPGDDDAVQLVCSDRRQGSEDKRGDDGGKLMTARIRIVSLGTCFTKAGR